MVNSGKNEGVGGIEALVISATLISRINQLRLLWDFIWNTNRERFLALILPILANIDMEAHPWARDKRMALKNKVFLLRIRATSRKVICVTLL